MTQTQTQSPKAEDIAYVRYQVPDLKAMREFLIDFGFDVSEGVSETGERALFSRGRDPSPYLHVSELGNKKFLGMGFHMQSLEDLEALAKLDGASPISDVPNADGAKRVRFTDPNGFEVDGLYGFAAPRDDREPLGRSYNNMAERQRIGEAVKLKGGPARVFRFGHLVANVIDFRESEAWYKARFGFLTGHEIYRTEETNVLGAFLRCDLGDRPTDHHTFFLVGMGKAGHGHAAFEVSDWDAVMLGHDYLRARGHRPHWGIGKHKLGSQVFDYWLDPFDNVLEHFTDGDLFDANEPPTLEPLDELLGVQWGPSKPVSGVGM